MSKGDSGLGGEQVEGRRAVIELLRAGKRRVRTVYMSNAAVDDEIAERAGGALKLVAPERVEQLAKSDVHQGVVALAAP